MAVLLITLVACGGADDDTAVRRPSPSVLPVPSTSSTTPGPSSPESTSATTSSPPMPSEATTSQPPPTSGATCVEQVIAGLSLEERVGQLFMGAVYIDEDPAFVPSALGEAHTGAVLLLGNTADGADLVNTAVDRATTVAGNPAGVAPIIAVDQEGGRVQRLHGPGFDDIPSAEEQASMPDLRANARKWGEQLGAVNVNLNLAPVADVVPESVGNRNQPVGALDRGYGSDPKQVSASVAAFIRGMEDSGIATAVKHFPGLGTVVGNTDFESGVVDSSTTRGDPNLAPFEAGVKAGARFVMVALATYTKIDADHRAVFSPVVIQKMLRNDFGFDGVVLSDDLGAAAEVSQVPPGQRALRFLRAGGDMMIVAEPQALLSMADAVVAKAKTDSKFQARVERSLARVLAAKQDMGLLPCGP